jgi:hypothetical protein
MWPGRVTATSRSAASAASAALGSPADVEALLAEEELSAVNPEGLAHEEAEQTAAAATNGVPPAARPSTSYEPDEAEAAPGPSEVKPDE